MFLIFCSGDYDLIDAHYNAQATYTSDGRSHETAWGYHARSAAPTSRRASHERAHQNPSTTRNRVTSAHPVRAQSKPARTQSNSVRAHARSGGNIMDDINQYMRQMFPTITRRIEKRFRDQAKVARTLRSE